MTQPKVGTGVHDEDGFKYRVFSKSHDVEVVTAKNRGYNLTLHPGDNPSQNT